MRTERIGIVQHVGPYDLSLSLRVAATFNPNRIEETPVLRTALRTSTEPVAVQVEQIGSEPPLLGVSLLMDEAPGRPAGDQPAPAESRAPVSAELAAETLGLVALMTGAELDLREFYKSVRGHKLLERITRRLFGVKPFRPRSLLEMLVVAVTEQQISLAASYRIRERILLRFGEPIAGLRVFPKAETLASASIEDLMATGLSHRKAEYVQGAAAAVASGKVDDEHLRSLPFSEAKQMIMGLRGFGPWSADYVLVRYLGSVNAVPIDDLGVQNVVGEYMGHGKRLTAAKLEEVLEPFAPYRGLAVFYLLANHRLTAGRSGKPRPHMTA